MLNLLVPDVESGFLVQMSGFVKTPTHFKELMASTRGLDVWKCSGLLYYIYALEAVPMVFFVLRMRNQI